MDRIHQNVQTDVSPSFELVCYTVFYCQLYVAIVKVWITFRKYDIKWMWYSEYNVLKCLLNHMQLKRRLSHSYNILDSKKSRLAQTFDIFVQLSVLIYFALLILCIICYCELEFAHFHLKYSSILIVWVKFKTFCYTCSTSIRVLILSIMLCFNTRGQHACINHGLLQIWTRLGIWMFFGVCRSLRR